MEALHTPICVGIVYSDYTKNVQHQNRAMLNYACKALANSIKFLMLRQSIQTVYV